MTAKLIGYLAPPSAELAIVVGGVSECPVDLRRNVVEVVAAEPCERVGEDAGILPVGAWAWRYAIFGCHGGAGGGSSGRAYAETHIGLGGLNHGIHGLDHAVDVVAPPVAEIHARFGRLPLGVVGGGVVGGYAVGVEIVVEEQAIDVVIGDNLFAHVHNPVDALLLSGVEN